MTKEELAQIDDIVRDARNQGICMALNAIKTSKDGRWTKEHYISIVKRLLE